MSKKVTIQDKQTASEINNVAGIDALDPFSIDPALRQELEAKNLAFRWINGHKFKQAYGFDARRWAPYKRESKPLGGSESFGYTDPEGFIRRGDLILAAQPMAVAEARKSKVRAKTKALERQQSGAGDQLKKSFADAGIKSKVFEGYDENE
jgi:hypothetical protein